MSKYNGEVVAIDICYPFLDAHPDVNGGKSPALILIDSLSSYVNCSPMPQISGKCVLDAFLNDWVRPLGKPRRILLDNGCPGFKNHLWAESNHVFGWQLAQAPPKTQSQNGLAERAVRSLKVAAGNILSSESLPKIEQTVLTLAVIAKNHAPHTITGLPPAMEMLGRSDILSGFAQTAFNHNPDSTAPAVKQMNSVRNITNAQNAVIHADANRAIKTCIIRSAKGHS